MAATASDREMDPFFERNPMLSQYLEHRSQRKTGSHFSADALGPEAILGHPANAEVVDRKKAAAQDAVLREPGERRLRH